MHGPAEHTVDAVVPKFGEERGGSKQSCRRWAGANSGEFNAVGRGPGSVAAELGGVVFGIKIAAAAPGFVADAPILHIKRFGVAISSALIGQGRRTGWRIAVFDPLIKLLGGQAAEVGREVGLSADKFAEASEFDCAKRIGFVSLGPAAIRVGRPLLRVDPEVRTTGSFVARTDAIAPIVLIGKTTARPANHAGFDFTKGLNEFFAEAVDVGDGGLLVAHPDAIVDNAADVFNEVAVNFRRDEGGRFVREGFRGARRRRWFGGQRESSLRERKRWCLGIVVGSCEE